MTAERKKESTKAEGAAGEERKEEEKKEEEKLAEEMLDHRRQVMEAAVEAGHILLESGAEIFRVEETIDRICRHYGVDSENAFVLSNGIFATAGNEREQYYAKVQHIPVSGARLNRVAAVNQLSREIEEGRYTVEQVQECLRQIRNMPGKTNRVQIVAAGVGSGAFCYLFGGNLRDSAAAFLAGFLLYIFILYLGAPHFSKIISNIVGGAMVTLISVFMYQIGVGEHLNQMIIGSIMPLIPGISFTNAIRDIADGDYIAGSVRMLDAILVFLCIAMGVGLVMTGYHRFL